MTETNEAHKFQFPSESANPKRSDARATLSVARAMACRVVLKRLTDNDKCPSTAKVQAHHITGQIHAQAAPAHVAIEYKCAIPHREHCADASTHITNWRQTRTRCSKKAELNNKPTEITRSAHAWLELQSLQKSAVTSLRTLLPQKRISGPRVAFAHKALSLCS